MTTTRPTSALRLASRSRFTRCSVLVMRSCKQKAGRQHTTLPSAKRRARWSAWGCSKGADGALHTGNREAASRQENPADPAPPYTCSILRRLSAESTCAGRWVSRSLNTKPAAASWQQPASQPPNGAGRLPQAPGSSEGQRRQPEGSPAASRPPSGPRPPPPHPDPCPWRSAWRRSREIGHIPFQRPRILWEPSVLRLADAPIVRGSPNPSCCISAPQVQQPAPSQHVPGHTCCPLCRRCLRGGSLPGPSLPWGCRPQSCTHHPCRQQQHSRWHQQGWYSSTKHAGAGN